VPEDFETGDGDGVIRLRDPAILKFFGTREDTALQSRAWRHAKLDLRSGA